jgi:hypothetical protein
VAICSGSALSEAQLTSRVAAIKELLEAFRFERGIYMAITLMSLFILLGSAMSLMFRDRSGMFEGIGLFSASGAITYTTGRLLRMWSDAIRILGVIPEESGSGESKSKEKEKGG